jgi:type I restriction enzyme S subunit
MKLTMIGEFLKRSKIPIDILDEEHYNRVTIRINHNGVSLRDNEIGKKIGTKKQFILKSGQFILSKIDARYGAFGIAPEEVEGSIITGNFLAYNVDKKQVNIEWFNQFTNSPLFYEVCERASSGITHRKYLDEKVFLNYEILLPSVEEQLFQIEKIKNQKLSFDELSTELTHQLTLVKKLRQQLLQDAVQGKLVPQNPNDEPAGELLKKIKAEKQILIADGKLKKDKELPPIKAEEIPFEIPDGWIWCRLGEVVTQLFDGPFGSHLKSIDYTNSGIQVIRLQNLGVMKFKEEKETFVSQEKYESIIQHTVYEGDIIIGSFLADGVNCVVLPELRYTAIAKADCFTIRIKHKMLLNTFIMFLLSSNPMFIELSKLLRGMTRLRINTTQLKNIPVPLPPLSEQHRIAQKLDELMQTCDALEASIKESAAQNNKLLQQVLREALRKEAVGV